MAPPQRNRGYPLVSRSEFQSNPLKLPPGPRADAVKGGVASNPAPTGPLGIQSFQPSLEPSGGLDGFLASTQASIRSAERPRPPRPVAFLRVRRCMSTEERSACCMCPPSSRSHGIRRMREWPTDSTKHPLHLGIPKLNRPPSSDMVILSSPLSLALFPLGTMLSPAPRHHLFLF